MSVAETSVESYNHLRENGNLGDKQSRVLDAVRRFPEATAGELFSAMSDLHDTGACNVNVHARLNELRKQGAVRNPGKRACAVTGRKCFTWAAVAA